MAKRFIDTNMFNDEWICNLSKDSKLFFIYFITTCDHAGVLKLNKKLCEFQTGLKSIDTLIKELGNSLITVSEQSSIYFMPRFLKFQYPNFPQSQVRQQESAIKILENYGINIEKINSYLTLSKDLVKTYVSVNDSVSVLKEKKQIKISFDKSPFFDKMYFTTSFPDWSKEKKSYYYDSALAYSTEGNKYIDWGKAISNWAKRDELQGKIKFESKPEKSKQAPDYQAFLNG